MKKLFFLSLVLVLGCATQVCLGRIIKWNNNKLVISAEAPPALIYVLDSNGNRTGANPALPLTSYGQQAGAAFGLNEIPNSLSSQTNLGLGTDTNNLHSSSHTMWDINIFDGGNQTYTLNVKGVTLGVEEIAILGLVKAGGKSVKPAKANLKVLVNVGATRQISLTFDPVKGKVVTQRIVEGGDLLLDVQTACQLNLINPDGTCQDLQTKADSILKDSQNNDAKSEIQHLQVFLSSLQSDGKKHVQDPAFTILQDEAKTLLSTLNAH